MQPDNDELEGEFVLDNASETLTAEPPQSPHRPNIAKSTGNPYIGTHSKKNPSTPHFFTAYSHHPKNVWFDDQEQNEEIILIIRRHFITNVPWITTAIIFALFPIALPLILRFSPIALPSTEVQLLIIALYYLGIFGFILLSFTLWYFNVGVITNIRIRDIDIHGLLYRDISETKLETVQDVSYNQIGLIRSIFNYGDVFVQTAGTIANVEFDRAPKPATVARIIGDIVG